MKYDAYLKLTNDNKLNLDIAKLKTDVVIPKQGEGIKLNHDGTLSIDRNVLTSMINVNGLLGLQIARNELIVNENTMSKNLIRLNSNSPLVRRDNNFFELKCDRVSTDTDFVTGVLMVKSSYVMSFINKDINNLTSIMFNFITEPLKKHISINSTLFTTSDNDSYIKLLYNNQGIIFKFNDMFEYYPRIYFSEVIIPTTETILKECVISFYYYKNLSKFIFFVNDVNIYNKTLFLRYVSMFTHQYHNYYLCNNIDNTQSFNGKFYYYSCLQNITEHEAMNLHRYYKYIHNI